MTAWNVFCKPVKPAAEPSYNQYWQQRSLYRPIGNYTPVPQGYDLKNNRFQFSNKALDWPTVNDPCTVLYNEKDGLYYSWILYRDELRGGFPTDWVEMVSKDCRNWEQRGKRLERGVHAAGIGDNRREVAFMGGSAWADKQNRFGFGEGAVLFLVSLSPCVVNGARGGDQCVALFVAPDGLGTPIQKELSCLIFAENPTGTDWRDTRMQWDEEHQQLLFVISNHRNIQFFANKSRDISAFEPVQTFNCEVKNGIECPEFHPIVDSATGERLWLLVASKQVPGFNKATPEQSILWWTGSWSGQHFTPRQSGALEYGYDYYAASVSEPQQNNAPKCLLMRGHIGNWAYLDTCESWPQKGFIGGCWEDRKLIVENGIAKVCPLMPLGGLKARSSAPAKAAPTWIKAQLIDKGKGGEYALRWSSGDKVLLRFDGTLSINTAKSGAVVLPGAAYAPLVTRPGELDIFVNGCCLSIYISGKQACFQIYPRGRLVGLRHAHGAPLLKDIKYYDAAPLYAAG